jgi:hypothetical protein
MTKPKIKPRRGWRDREVHSMEPAALSAGGRAALEKRLQRAALSDVAALIGEERETQSGPSTGEVLASMRALAAALEPAERELQSLDERTASKLEAHAWTLPAIHGQKPADLGRTVAAWRAAVEKGIRQEEKRRPAGADRQRRIAAKLRAIFGRHGLPFGSSPTSKAAAVLGIALAEIGLPADHPYNYIRQTG